MLKAFKLPKLALSISFVLIIFLLLFPKGGIKLNGNPITIGYILLFFISFFLLVRKNTLRNQKFFKILLYILPFQIFSIFSILLNGYENTTILASYLIHFFLIPYAIFLTFPEKISSIQINYLLKWICRGINFLAVYGIFLFFYKLLFGRFVEIPFLTVNYHDLNLLENSKCIDRGGYFKLISTYNNGNLYGICLLMLYPLYRTLETRKLFKFLLILSFVLTISRTVWIGLIFAELLSFFLEKKTKYSLMYFINFCLLIFICLTILQWYFELPLEFFLDKSLGHRIPQFEALNDFSFFGKDSFNGIHEITYLGVYKSFGFLGLVSFLIAMLYPVLKILCDYLNNKQLITKQLIHGLAVYSIISLSDGAVLLIPVMCFYWIICWLGLVTKEPSSSTFNSVLA